MLNSEIRKSVLAQIAFRSLQQFESSKLGLLNESKSPQAGFFKR